MYPAIEMLTFLKAYDLELREYGDNSNSYLLRAHYMSDDISEFPFHGLKTAAVSHICLALVVGGQEWLGGHGLLLTCCL